MKKSELRKVIKEEIKSILNESDESIQKIADILKKKSLLSAGSEFEKTFGKKNVQTLGGDMPLPPVYYKIKVGGKSIIVVNKKYVDGADLIVGDIAIGYE